MIRKISRAKLRQPPTYHVAVEGFKGACTNPCKHPQDCERRVLKREFPIKQAARPCCGVSAESCKTSWRAWCSGSPWRHRMVFRRFERLSAWDDELPVETISSPVCQLQLAGRLRTRTPRLLKLCLRGLQCPASEKAQVWGRLTVAGLEKARRSGMFGFLSNPQDLVFQQGRRSTHEER